MEECAEEGEDIIQQQRTVDGLMSQFGVGDKGLSVLQTEAVKQLLHRNLSVFSRGETDLGRTHLTWMEFMELIQVMLSLSSYLREGSPFTCSKR